ncbi:MAG: DUF3311 domain-containing protein [Parvibaculum sedimenti]|uniref:DUF3311 domain-containing protein n=1 Tax=Parvibaculum sedimenti TaxID=2608632 RepID=UPI003BB57188
MADENNDARPHKRRWLVPLIFLPFPAMLWVPFFNSAEPALAGIPFFYWYQLLWIALGAVLTIAVYFATE